MPDAQWFELCGALDEDGGRGFRIGTGATAPSGAEGRLSGFANDLPGWYWKNFGKVEVTVLRVS
jgi:hypothetical protein